MQPVTPSSVLSSEEQAFLDTLVAAGDLDDIIPTLARDRQAIQRIESIVRGQQTAHELIHGDARKASMLDEESIQLVVTSPPYWTLKRYNDHEASARARTLTKLSIAATLP